MIDPGGEARGPWRGPFFMAKFPPLDRWDRNESRSFRDGFDGPWAITSLENLLTTAWRDFPSAPLRPRSQKTAQTTQELTFSRGGTKNLAMNGADLKRPVGFSCRGSCDG